MGESMRPSPLIHWISMVTAPIQFPCKCVPHFASMLIEAFLCVQFVPLTPNEMRHKNISYDFYIVLYFLKRREMRRHTRNVNQTHVKLASNNRAHLLPALISGFFSGRNKNIARHD